MNILIISSIYPEPKEYGIPDDSKAVHYFAKELVQMGHSVTVYHLYSSPVSRILKNKNNCLQLKENYQDGVHVVFGSIQLLIPHKYSGLMVQQKMVAHKFLRYSKKNELNYDLVITHFPMTLLWFAREIAKSKKISCVMHGVDIRELEKMKRCQQLRTIQMIENISDVVSFRSVSLREKAKKLGFVVDYSPVLFSGIPNEIIPPNYVFLKKIQDTDIKKIVFAGKVNKQKKVDTIIKAISLTKSNTTCYIIGDGPERANMENLAKQLGLNNRISFLGKQKREEVAEKMFSCGIFVMVSQNETLGLVYLEAMAQGCITIGTKGEGIDGVIKNGENGFLIEPNDPNSLAKLLDIIVNMDIEKRQVIQKNAYDTATKMTNRRMALEYLTYLSNGRGD